MYYSVVNFVGSGVKEPYVPKSLLPCDVTLTIYLFFWIVDSVICTLFLKANKKDVVNLNLSCIESFDMRYTECCSLR